MSTGTPTPAASVVIVARDEAATLGAAVSGFLDDHFAASEVVVIDDASTDPTPEVLAAITDPRLVVVRNPVPFGIARSRNRAIALARGAVVLVADGDDLPVPGRLSAQMGFFETHPGVAVLGGFAEAVDDDGCSLGILKSPPTHREISEALGRRSPLLHPTLAVRKSALVAVGGYREKFPVASDLDLLFRLVERFQAATIPRVLCGYRLSPWSVSVRAPAVSAECIGAAKRFSEERVRNERDSYADWVPPAFSDACPADERPLRRAYHLLAGKLAAATGNLVLARRHFASAGLAGAPYLGATLLGEYAYCRLQSILGTAYHEH